MATCQLCSTEISGTQDICEKCKKNALTGVKKNLTQSVLIRVIFAAAAIALLGYYGKQNRDSVSATTQSNAAQTRGKLTALHKKAEEGDIRSMTKLGIEYYIGSDLPSKSSSKIKLFNEAANKGDCEAVTFLGATTEIGTISQDVFLEKAETITSPCKYAFVGMLRVFRTERADLLYKFNRMIESTITDIDNSLSAGESINPEILAIACGALQKYDYCVLGAKNGGILANRELAFCYKDEKCGYKKDTDKAISYFEAAAALGDRTSMEWLGHLFENGYGVLRDTKKAMTYYERAAQHGSYFAIDKMCSQYANGIDVPQNFVKAKAHAILLSGTDYRCLMNNDAYEKYNKINDNDFRAAQTLAGDLTDNYNLEFKLPEFSRGEFAKPQQQPATVSAKKPQRAKSSVPAESGGYSSKSSSTDEQFDINSYRELTKGIR